MQCHHTTTDTPTLSLLSSCSRNTLTLYRLPLFWLSLYGFPAQTPFSFLAFFLSLYQLLSAETLPIFRLETHNLGSPTLIPCPAMHLEPFAPITRTFNRYPPMPSKSRGFFFLLLLSSCFSPHKTERNTTPILHY